MKRFPILGALLLIPAVILFATVGCTPNKKDEPKPVADAAKAKDADKGKEGGEKKKKEEITTAPDATVKGIVKFKGTPPAPKEDKRIAEHKEAKECLTGAREIDKQEQTWIIGKDDGVANVIISLAPPADKKFKKLDDKALEAFKKPVVLDQPFCNYVPHVVALYADIQPLVAKNDAKVSHNVKILAGPQIGGTKDITLSPGKDTGDLMFNGGPEAVIDTTCSIHSWMSAKIALFNHPYFAVTDKDGHFEIKNVPVDTALTVYMWHESNPSKVEVQKLTAKKGDNDVPLTISPK
jgi:hypothetical protein